MPIAECIDGCWPPTLFEDDIEGTSLEAWCALHVRPRAEKVVSRQLREERLSYFLPLSQQSRCYQRRNVLVQNLVFPGYVFVRGNPEATRSFASSAFRVVACLEDRDQIALHQSLKGLHAVIQAGDPVTREERLQPGMAVEIVSGPLAGYRGHVIDNKKALRFVIQLDFIQQGASVAVDATMVKAL